MYGSYFSRMKYVAMVIHIVIRYTQTYYLSQYSIIFFFDKFNDM